MPAEATSHGCGLTSTVVVCLSSVEGLVQAHSFVVACCSLLIQVSRKCYGRQCACTFSPAACSAGDQLRPHDVVSMHGSVQDTLPERASLLCEPVSTVKLNVYVDVICALSTWNTAVHIKQLSVCTSVWS